MSTRPSPQMLHVLTLVDRGDDPSWVPLVDGKGSQSRTVGRGATISTCIERGWLKRDRDGNKFGPIELTDAGRAVLQASREAEAKAREEAKKPVLPIVQGDWVAETSLSSNIRIGRVRHSYWDREPGGKVLMDVAIYSQDGDKIGRDSPHMGGPKSFEPAVPYDERWTRIAQPEFPLTIDQVLKPVEGEPNRVTMHYSVHHDKGGGVVRKAARTRFVKQSADRPRRASVRIIQVEKPSNGLDLEIAGLRRAAQEMRDTARALDGAGRDAVIARAEALEREAEALAS